MSEDAAQNARLDAIDRRQEHHEAHCERRISAVWTEISKLRDDVRSVNHRIWVVIAGIALLLGGEAGLFHAVLGLSQ